jgi:hypothetical protein
MSTDFRAPCAELQGATVIGPEWQPCVKLPITVHVREQRPGETHSSTREGITPLRSDDLIMRGVQGEEYPIGRELFNQTYRMGVALAQPEPEGVTDDEEELMAAWDKAIRLPRTGRLAEYRAWLAHALALVWAVGRRPTTEPVPVSERLPGPEDCDAEGRCWWFSPPACGPHKIRPCWTLDSETMEGDTHWLPHHALPIPAP